MSQCCGSISVDLGATAHADITALPEIFDFAKDYLGLLKAAIIAAGIVPPGIEGSGQNLADLLARIVGPGMGLEIVSNVNEIPKGSRLAVSTNLLASLIAVCMRNAARRNPSPANSPNPNAASSPPAPSSANGSAAPVAAGRIRAASGPA